MAAIAYYLSLPLLYAISWLPFPALYLLSDCVHFILFKTIRYRTQIITQNLKNAFPDKSEEELNQIKNTFSRYFCDLVLETIKTLTISPSTLLKHVSFHHVDIFKEYFEARQSVIIVMGHMGNWELGGARFSLESIHPLYVIYKPLANPYFNQLVYHMRTRLGNKLYAMKETFRGMIQNKNITTATAFIADQTPNPSGAYWTTFLNQETPVFTGTAKIAKKLNYPIIYISIKRKRRGYYEMSGELLVENPNTLSEEQISDLHTQRLEQDIIENPSFWLWTHRRWKHKRPKD